MKPCPYCGTNPIPHKTHKFYESLDIALSPLERKLAKSFLGRTGEKVAEWIALALFYLLKPFGFIKTNADVEKVPFARAKTIWQEAISQNIEMKEIKPFGQSIDLYQFKLNGKNSFFMNLPHPKGEQSSNLSWVDDKFLLKQKLTDNFLPAAPGSAFTSISKALMAFDSLEKPVIVKPRVGSRGRHTTTLIFKKEEFVKAFKIAKELCHWVIVEEHLFGDVQRATLVGGKLSGVLGGSPPRVTGDGKHTIAELIKITDQQRPEKVKEIKPNLLFLQRLGFDLNSVLAPGQTIDLSEKIGVNYGGTSYDATPYTHSETKEMFEKAAKVIGNSILGFDFIIPDIRKSYKEQKCGIIECNGAPFIQLHHDVLIGEPINVAKDVWELVKNSQ